MSGATSLLKEQHNTGTHCCMLPVAVEYNKNTFATLRKSQAALALPVYRLSRQPHASISMQLPLHTSACHVMTETEPTAQHETTEALHTIGRHMEQ